MPKNQTRIEVEPVYTLGDLIDLVTRAQAVVDHSMPGQSQRDTPIKFDVTLGGKVRAITLSEIVQ